MRTCSFTKNNFNFEYQYKKYDLWKRCWKCMGVLIVAVNIMFPLLVRFQIKKSMEQRRLKPPCFALLCCWWRLIWWQLTGWLQWPIGYIDQLVSYYNWVAICCQRIECHASPFFFLCINTLILRYLSPFLVHTFSRS